MSLLRDQVVLDLQRRKVEVLAAQLKQTRDPFQCRGGDPDRRRAGGNAARGRLARHLRQGDRHRSGFGLRRAPAGCRRRNKAALGNVATRFG